MKKQVGDGGVCYYNRSHGINHHIFIGKLMVIKIKSEVTDLQKATLV